MTTLLRRPVPLPSLSSRDHSGVTVVSPRGELDFRGSSALQAYLSDIRRKTRPRSVADLTGLAFIDCACLTVLVRHCKDTTSQGGSFALAGPHGTVHRILAVTGLLTWFDVHDTVEEAISRTGTQRSPALPAIPPGRAAPAAASRSCTLMDMYLSLPSRSAEMRGEAAI
jgi:anti-anti-sigma factor